MPIIMANFSKAQDNLKSSFVNANQASLYSGLDDLSFAWTGVFQSAATTNCYPDIGSAALLFIGNCGGALLDLTNEVTYADDGTQIHFANVDMTSSVLGIIGSFPVTDYISSTFSNAQKWINFGAYLG